METNGAYEPMCALCWVQSQPPKNGWFWHSPEYHAHKNADQPDNGDEVPEKP